MFSSDLSVGLFVCFLCWIGQTDATCSSGPQLFLHQRTNILQLVEGNSSCITLTDVNREFLTCRAAQNVEWFYEGIGEPSKFQESSSIRINSEAEDVEYCMTSKISFYAKQSDTDLAKHTGRYICREIGNSSNYASTYVFLGRRNAPAFLQSRKTMTLSLSHENVTDSSFTIPCATSTPFVTVRLLKKQTGEANSAFKLISTSDALDRDNLNNSKATQPEIIFDPRVGFRVPVLSSEEELSGFYGDYKCAGKINSSSAGKQQNDNRDEDYVIYSLVSPQPYRFYPPEPIIFTSSILNLTCESTEESVILKEVKIRPSRDQYFYDEAEDDDNDDDVNSNSVEDIMETVEKKEDKLHVANYLDMNPVPGSYGEFQCLAEKDKRILHSWQYRILGKKEEKLSGIKFNKRDGSFSCRSKSGLPAKLSFISCRTPSECRINGQCLQKSETCRGYSNATKALCHRGNNFCGKIFYKGGSGIIRCIGEGIDQTRAFTDEANDQRLRMGFHKLKPSETVFVSLNSEMHQTDEVHLTEGQDINLIVKLGYFYFVDPVQWAIKFENGSSIHITPMSEDFHKTKLYRSILARIRLPIVSEESSKSPIVGINALIPLRSSELPSWKTITLPINVIPISHISESSSNVSSSSPSDSPHEARLDIEQKESITEVEVNEEIIGDSGFVPTGRSDIEIDVEVQDATEVVQSLNSQSATSEINEKSLDKSVPISQGEDASVADEGVKETATDVSNVFSEKETKVENDDIEHEEATTLKT